MAAILIAAPKEKQYQISYNWRLSPRAARVETLINMDPRHSGCVLGKGGEEIEVKNVPPQMKNIVAAAANAPVAQWKPDGGV
jgi:hypothetical protein